MSALDAVVPTCTSGTAGECLSAEAQGAVVYNDFQACATSPLLFPGFNLMPRWFLATTHRRFAHAVVYFLTLVWAFFGVAAISDIFMSAIEQITSAEKVVIRKTRSGREQRITVQVWNPTVANLTLMALGSSAPEIMLAILETLLTLGQPAGELGPATIVGSAAFNLLMITSVCIMSVPEGETRAISDFPVFAFTCSFSVWAYLWMLIVYKVWTPDQVTIAEALLTLAYLPILVYASYAISIRAWERKSKTVLSDAEEEQQTDAQEAHKQQQKQHKPLEAGYRIIGVDVDGPDGLHMHLRGNDLESPSLLEGTSLDDMQGPALTGKPKHQASLMIEDLDNQQRTLSLTADDIHKALAGVRADNPESLVTAAKGLVQQNSERSGKPLTAIQYKMHARKAIGGRSPVSGHHRSTSVYPEPAKDEAWAHVHFAANGYMCAEVQGKMVLKVACDRLQGHEKSTIQVHFATRDGTALGSLTTDDRADYKSTYGTLTFEPGVTEQEIVIEIFQDDLAESDEEFFVDLAKVPGCPVHIARETAAVTIVDSTEPGRLGFGELTVEVPVTARRALVPVVRRNGADGHVSMKYRTGPVDAMAGVHFQHTEGELHFEPGETAKDIVIPLLQAPGCTDLHFTLFLSEPYKADLYKKRACCDVYFVADKQFGILMRMVQSMMRRESTGGARPQANAWLSQFKEAVIPGGESTLEDLQTSNKQPLDYVLHYVSISFKVLFALVPPPEYKSGGPCFVVALLFIGFLTFIVGEFASLFGCALGLPDAVTAISFVALGTSLPDTFASLQAAREAPDADAAIGNVTGSNSVNVFLGLGLPWIIASIYYAAKGQAYETPAGALSFSVTIYSCFSVMCLALLYYKRVRCGGELGGRGWNRKGVAALLAVLWLAYIVLSSVQATGGIKGF